MYEKSDILWEPTRDEQKATALWRFATEHGFDGGDFDALHKWSITDKGAFWSAVWDFCGVIGDKGEAHFVSDENAPMTGARFFPDAKLNLAENLLRGDDSRLAVIAVNESGRREDVTIGELKARVARIADGLKNAGVKEGDRVASVQVNDVDALVALLATVAIGGVWTSCSPDFGETAIIERIGQVEPKVLFTAARYIYNGKAHDIGARIAGIARKIPSITTIVLSGEGEIPGFESIRQSEFGAANAAPSFPRLPFDHPTYILYTSGTTGAPKAIVHRLGGVLLKHVSEHVLHGDVRSHDRLIWYSNTAWMMYHWMISALAVEATIVIYDGVPVLKTDTGFDCAPLWNLVDDARLTHLGVSPKYLSALAAENYLPKTHHDLSSLRALMAVGAPVYPHHFEWVYASVKSDIPFSSITGGTELIGCFITASPIHPVRCGQLTVPALGMAVAVFDDDGKSVIGEPGELVCTEAFPSMPLTFWGKDGIRRYHDTYFSQFPEVWTHGDIAEITATGGAYIHGRSDNTINPGGVRIGTAEIYTVCENTDGLEDYVAFGASNGDDEEVILCLQPQVGVVINDEMIKTLRGRIRSEASPRHVPAWIYIVGSIPYTINGKKVESAARASYTGMEVKNRDALANPECLDEYKKLKPENSL